MKLEIQIGVRREISSLSRFMAFAFGLLIVIALAGCAKIVAEDDTTIDLVRPATLLLPPASSPRIPALQPSQFERAPGKLRLRADAAELDVQALPSFISGTQLFHYEAFLLAASELWIPIGRLELDASGNGGIEVAYTSGDAGITLDEDGGFSGLFVPPESLIGAAIAIVDDGRVARVPDPYIVLEGRRELDGGQ